MDKQQWHTLEGADVLAQLGSDVNRGLGAAEAADCLRQYGPNRLPEPRQTPLLALFIEQFRDLMIQILLLAAAVAAVVGEPQDSVTILVIVLLNAVIGVVQQYRAEHALAALRRLSAPVANVIRDGEHRTIPAADLVPGDTVVLEAGAQVPADLRLLESVQLQVDESMLTGESHAVEKNTAALPPGELPVGDRRNLAFCSTLVTRGRGIGVVVATGLQTEIGGVAELLASAEKQKSPLQQRIAAFGKRLSLVILLICGGIFLAGVWRGEDWMLMLLTAVSLAVAAIPEALPAVVSVSLALGAHKMSRQNSLVRNLPAVETLGSVSVICADKTGTLTENRMVMEQLLVSTGSVAELPPQTGDLPELWGLLGRALALSNDVESGADGASGDPTEVALLVAAESAGYVKSTLLAQMPRLAEIPFSSERQRMTSVHRDGSGVVAFCKGSPEAVLACCDQAMGKTGPEPLQAAYWGDEAARLAGDGYRVLALAFRRLDRAPTEAVADVEQAMTLLGLVALMDPPRQEAFAAVADCYSAGITPIMITGDHPGTALAIALRLGIVVEGARVMSGPELQVVDDQTLADSVLDCRVYARVSPAQKIRLVKALQERGQFIAMTGDGVNDAPALKRADIGVAMGRSGTDVAREAADMVLLDDNFATIVAAVREGRRVFDNIRKFIKYTMTSNSGEIWTLALAPLFGMPLPLLPIHILWINLVTDGLPGLALTAQREEARIMQRPPRPAGESIFAGGMWQHILVIGLLIGALSLGVQVWAVGSGVAAWQTMVFTVLTFSQLVHVLVIRNDTESLFRAGLFQNPALLGAVALTVALQLAVVYLPPLNAIFRTAPLSAQELLICACVPLAVLAVVEVEKWLSRGGRIYRAPRADGT